MHTTDPAGQPQGSYGLTTPGASRLFGLDAMRAAAILLVLEFHFSIWVQGARSPSLVRWLPDGVDVFFALSGFLVGGVWIHTLTQATQPTLRTGLRFLGRRWFRTLPNYYLFLGLNIALAAYELPVGNVLTENWPHYLSFTAFASTGTTGFFHESWSLAVEEWFYVALVAMGLPLMWLWGRTRAARSTVLASAALLIVLPLLWRLRVPLHYALDATVWDDFFRKTTPRRFDAIGWGVLAAWAQYYYPQFVRRWRGWAFGVGAVLLLFNAEVLLTGTAYCIYKGHIHFVQQGIGCALLLPLLNHIATPRGLWAKGVEHISRISYSLYLVHFTPLLRVAEQYLAAPQTFPEQLAYGLAFLGLSIGLASLVYAYWERPWLALRQRWLG
jgi:peptidoglycan/LPS O-acetylase OafA/YrhL